MRKKGLRGRVLSLRVRYADRETRSTQRQLPEPTDDDYALRGPLEEMLDDLWQQGMALRLVGVAMTGFESGATEGQLSLFEGEEAGGKADDATLRGLLEATDMVKERFGEGAVRYGRELRLEDAGTGTTAKNPADYK